MDNRVLLQKQNQISPLCLFTRNKIWTPYLRSTDLSWLLPTCSSCSSHINFLFVLQTQLPCLCIKTLALHMTSFLSFYRSQFKNWFLAHPFWSFHSTYHNMAFNGSFICLWSVPPTTTSAPWKLGLCQSCSQLICLASSALLIKLCGTKRLERNNILTVLKD